MCPDKKCPEETPCVKVSEIENKCADRKLIASNSNHNRGYENVNVITPEVNQITAYSEHLEFVNSPEQLSGIPKHTVLRFASKFIEFLKSIFKAKNLGNGAKVYKGLNTITNEQEFKTLKGTDSITVVEEDNEIKHSINNSWLAQQFTIPVVDYPVIDGKSIGQGVAIYSGLDNKKIQISKIKSNTLVIEKDLEGTITIESKNSFSYIKAYYVNSGYNPTQDSPADGSVIRPFPTFEEARKAVIREDLGGTILNPINAGARIIIQTDVITAVNPTINSITFELQNNISFIYTGTDLYAFDTEILYNLCPKNSNGLITQNLSMGLTGNGNLGRSQGIGFVRVIGANRGTNSGTTTNRIWFTLTEKETDNIGFVERSDYPDNIWQGVQMRQDNTTPVGNSYTPPYDMRWTTLLSPTTPLVYIKGNSFTSFSYTSAGSGTLNFNTLVNTAIHIEDTLLAMGKITVQPQSMRLAVQSGPGTIPNHDTVYKPKVFPAIYCKNANLYIKEIYHSNGGTFAHYGYDTLIKIVGSFNLQGKFNYDTNFYIKTFLDLSEMTQESISLNGSSSTALVASYIETFMKLPNYPNFSLSIRNTRLGDGRITKLYSGTTNVNIDTNGSLSTINDKPYISGLYTFTDDSAAATAGLYKNALYNLPDGKLTTL